VWRGSGEKTEREPGIESRRGGRHAPCEPRWLVSGRRALGHDRRGRGPDRGTTFALPWEDAIVEATERGAFGSGGEVERDATV